MSTTTNTTTRTVTTTLLENEGLIEGLRLDFSNGTSLAIMEHQLAPSIANRALWHGISAKLVDATAISRNPDTGRSASVDDKYNAAREVYERLLAGQWNKVRGDGTGAGSGGLLFRALCIAYPTKTPEQIREYLKGKSLADQAALRKSSKLATIVEELRAKDAVNGEPVDEEALFDGLED